MKHSLVLNPTLNKQVKRSRFCSLYCPLCFDYGVYNEMIINLRMMKTVHSILQKYVSAMLVLSLRTFHAPQLVNQALERNERYFED